jgi:hypothetical protein
MFDTVTRQDPHMIQPKVQPIRVDNARAITGKNLSFVAAPLFVFGYGVVQLIGVFGRSHGPGFVFTAGHFLFLVGLVLFGVVLARLRQMMVPTSSRRKVAADLTTVIGFVGLIAFIRIAIIDLVVGLRAADSHAMSALYGQFGNFPGVFPAAVYNIGPLLYEAAMIALLLQLAVLSPRRFPIWSPVLYVLGIVSIGINLNLLPLGAALFGFALVPRGPVGCKYPVTGQPAS